MPTSTAGRCATTSSPVTRCRSPSTCRAGIVWTSPARSSAISTSATSNGSGSPCSSNCQFVCPPTPIAACKTAATGTGILAMTTVPDDPTRNALVWTWKHGAATAPSELGAPLTETAYRLCMYDGTGQLMLQPRVGPGDDCAAGACWTATRHGYAYKNASGATEGITAIALATGDAGRAKVLVKAKGPQFDAQPLPPAQSPSPLVTQLFNSSTPACWGAAFSAPPIRQRGARWKDKND